MMKRWFSLFLCVLLVISNIPVVALAAEDVIEISSADDLISLAEKCSSDAYSSGKTFVLKKDIDLSESDFSVIPYLSGTFNGNGHTISGLHITGDGSYQGLFRYVSESAAVEDLTVTGTVTPSGTKEYIGGIAGENSGTIIRCTFEGTAAGYQFIGGIAGVNTESGIISSCTFSGNARGEHEVGGIVGKNNGIVVNCDNAGKINTVLMKSTQNGSFDIATLLENEFLDITDIGGIAGYSDGIVQKCKNTGAVGYERTGYNVGGIVGRSSGYVNECENKGGILGRKEIGGIVGQLVPYSYWDFSGNKLSALQSETETLNSLIDSSIKHYNASSKRVSDLLTQAKGDAELLTAELEIIAANTVDDLSNAAEAANDVIALLDEAIRAHDFSKSEALITELEEIIDTEPENIDVEALLDVLQNLLEESTGFINNDLIQRVRNIISELSFSIPNINKIFGYFSDISETATAIKNEVSEGGESFQSDVTAVTNQITVILDTFFGAAESVAEIKTDYQADISDTDTRDNTNGAVQDCSNFSDVQGDTNTGGIVGAISFEIDFDAEDELKLSDYLLTDARYLIYSVIRGCDSYGDITAKKECAGGVVGSMDFGAVIDSLGAGTIRVTNGDYAGGVAGKSTGSIKNSYSRTVLYGEKYIGGIVGSGSVVSDCLSYSFVEEASEYYGSVTGESGSKIQNNFFVENNLGGIDGISYSGAAEPVSYEKMLAFANAPNVFREIVVTFVADEKVIEKIKVEFGGSIKELPKIENDGIRYWKWDSFDKDHIYYSMTIGGEYKNPKTTISTGEELPLILVEGLFYEGQELSVSPKEMNAEDLIAAYCVSVSDYRGDLKVRFRTEEKGDLYTVEKGDKLIAISYEIDGSYIVFDMSNGATFAYFQKENHLLSLILAVGGIVIFLAVVIFLIVRRRVKKKSMANG